MDSFIYRHLSRFDRPNRRNAPLNAGEAVRAQGKSIKCTIRLETRGAVGAYSPSVAHMRLKLTSCQFHRRFLFQAEYTKMLFLTLISGYEEPYSGYSL